MIRLRQVVIVEGRYDKIALENLIDTTIIPTNGFSIFKDREKCALIRTLAQRDGVIVMTDSDNAGLMIRGFLKRICGGGKIIHVYVPQIIGKERRKSHPGKEGMLGVEGLPRDVLLTALQRSGVTAQCRPEARRLITKSDLFCRGLSGGQNSAQSRIAFMRWLRLPANLSANAFLDILNTLYDYDEFTERFEEWRNEADRK